MFKALLLVVLSFYCFDASALVAIRTNTDRVIDNDDVQFVMLDKHLVFQIAGDHLHEPTFLFVTEKAAKDSGFNSVAEMKDLLSRTQSFKGTLFILDCKLEVTDVKSCYFEL